MDLFFDAVVGFFGAAFLLGRVAFCFFAAGFAVSSMGVALRLSAVFFFSAVPCFALASSVPLSSAASGMSTSFFSTVSSSVICVSASTRLLFATRGELFSVCLFSIMAASSAVVGVLGVRFLGDLGGEGALGGQGTRLGGIAAVWMVRNVVSGNR